MPNPGEDSSYPFLLDRIVHGRWVGRTREMAEAKIVWRQAASGHGLFLIISGEPGIGKTRFVREMTAVALAMGGKILTGKCYAEGSTPYAPVPK